MELMKQFEKTLQGNRITDGFKDIKAAEEGVQKLTGTTAAYNKAKERETKLTERLAIAQTRQAKTNARISVQISEQNKLNKQAAKEQLGLVNAYDKLNNELKEARKEYKNLAAAEKANTREGEALLANITRLDKKLKDIDNTVGQNFRSVGNYSDALKDLNAKVDSSIKKFGQQVLAIAGVGIGLNELTGIVSTQGNLQQSINTLFEGTPEQAEEVQTRITALGDTFNKDYNEILFAANAASKEFGITLPAALDLIDQGFTKGADVRGQFLDQLEEYSTQFVNVGLNAEEAIAVITQSQQAGVFSDKGVDLIKEAGIRLSEMPKATQDALKAIDISASGIQERIQSGTSTLFEEVQAISNRLSQLPPQSVEVGQALADIFGGPGEDAKGFVLTLGTVETNLGLLEDKTTEYTKAQRAWSETLAEIKVSISKGLAPVLGFLAKNFDTILSVVVSLGAAFLTYKTAIIATNLTTKVFSATTKAAAAAQWLLQGGVKGVTAAIKTLDKTTKASILGALAGIAVGAADAFGLFGDEVEDTGKSLSAVERITREANASFAEEEAKLNSLFGQLKKTNAGTEEREQLINRINNTYGTTLQNLSDEAAFAAQVGEAYKEVTNQLRRKALLQAREGELIPLYQRQAEQLDRVNKEQERLDDLLNGRDISMIIDAEEFRQVDAIQTNLRVLNTTLNQTNKEIDDVIQSTNEQIKAYGQVGAAAQNASGGVTRGAAKLAEQEQKQLTRLQQLQKQLKENQQEREKILKTEQDASSETFKNLEKEDKELRNQIEVLKEILDLKKREQEAEREAEKLRQDQERLRKAQQEDRLNDAIAFRKEIEQNLGDSISQVEVEDFEKALEEEFEIRKDAVEKQSEFILENAELTAEERLAIEQETNNKLEQLDRQREDQLGDFYERVIDQNKSAAEEVTENTQTLAESLSEFTSEVSDLVEEVLDNSFERAQRAIDRDSEAVQNRIDQLRADARSGEIDNEEALVAEERKREELERKRLEQEKRRAEIQLILAGLKSFNESIDGGTSPTGALAQTGATITALLSLLDVAAFEHGGDIPGGEQLIRVNEKGPEFVAHAKATAKYGPELRAMNAGTFNPLDHVDDSTLQNLAHNPWLMTPANIVKEDNNQKVVNAISEMQSDLKDTILSRPAYMGEFYDKQTGYTIHQYDKDGTTHRVHTRNPRDRYYANKALTDKLRKTGI